MKVLIIEDENNTAASVKLLLKNKGCYVDVCHSGRDAIDIIKAYEYDVILLDLLLPDINGYEVLIKIRKNIDITAPVIVLTADCNMSIKKKCLSDAADDYIVKPYDGEELMARINAVTRRAKGHANACITTGNIVVNINSKSVLVDGKMIYLTDKEYRIMEMLSLKKGTPISKEQFLSYIYSGVDEPELKIIDVFVCKLRKKIAKANNDQSHIHTIWGRGYVLRDPIPTDHANASSVKTS